MMVRLIRVLTGSGGENVGNLRKNGAFCAGPMDRLPHPLKGLPHPTSSLRHPIRGFPHPVTRLPRPIRALLKNAFGRRRSADNPVRVPSRRAGLPAILGAAVVRRSTASGRGGAGPLAATSAHLKETLEARAMGRAGRWGECSPGLQPVQPPAHGRRTRSRQTPLRAEARDYFGASRLRETRGL
jgi:hypothetical protein